MCDNQIDRLTKERDVNFAYMLLMIAPVENNVPLSAIAPATAHATKKKRTSVAGARRFRSCEEARKAGFTHMRRGQAGYSKGLDRDGDGVACDKVK